MPLHPKTFQNKKNEGNLKKVIHLRINHIVLTSPLARFQYLRLKGVNF